MEENMKTYKILRPILGAIYKFWYNPKVIGSENIPKEGSIVVVGNHIHIMDQCNIIISTKRCIHYMAKKEYFEGKYKKFFKSVGCIPVDRSKKDDEAVSSALDVLRNGEALGLFPEGTRNGLKEERIKEIYDKYIEDIDYQVFFLKIKNNKTSQVNYLEELLNNKIITKEEFLDNLYIVDEFLNDLVLNKRITREDYFDHILLPFKFGAVSMAHKTDSYLVPFAITGDYKFRSKNLVIRIGKPFKADSDLEIANEKLNKVIRDLMKENLKNSGK
jgi:1-acyl-sn-glycerol-3-phosphate acyltransferase